MELANNRFTPRLLAQLPRLSSTPFTVLYVCLLGLTTLVLGLVDNRLHHEILEQSSTDVAHLESAPLWVLVASALWLPNLWWYIAVVLSAFLLAPVERRIGPGWIAAVFVSGHVVATLLTELPIEAGIDVGWLPESAAHRLDVGVSYGFYAVVAVFIGMYRGRARWALAALAVVSVIVPIAVDPDVTTAGHAVALAVGVTWWPLLA